MLTYPGAIVGNSPNCWPTEVYPRKWGVIHAFSSNATARETFDWFLNPDAGASTTGIIGKKGDIYLCMNPFFSHWGNCCPTNPDIASWPLHPNTNNFSWAVEFEKLPGNLEPLTPEQIQYGFPFIKWLCETCGTPKRAADINGGIMSHSFLDPVNRPGNFDPGPFPWQELYSYLGGKTLTELANYPIVSQQTSVTTDREPSENAAFDCVYAALGSAILWHQKKSQWDYTVNPDMLKDLFQGQGYVGGGNIALAINYCKGLGYELDSFSSPNNSQLVATMHELIQQQIPCIFTIVSIYDSRWWHVHAMFGEVTGGLKALDPYPNPPKPETNIKIFSDSQWASKLQTGAIWYLRKVGSPMGLPAGWVTLADGGIKSPESPYVVYRGFKDAIINNTPQWPASCYPLENEHHVDVFEQSNPSFGGGQQQLFSDAWLAWNAGMGVKKEWMGRELFYYRELAEKQKKLLTEKDAEIAALKANSGHDPADAAHIATLQTSMQSVAETVDHVVAELEVEAIKLREDAK